MTYISDQTLFFAIFMGLQVLSAAFPAWCAYTVLSSIPVRHRKQSPGLAFLLLIPFFSMIWAFFVHPRVAQSLKSYYDSHGTPTNGDYGGALALWSCLFGITCGPALLLVIIFYVKAFELSAQLPQDV
jgi:hypothetical protein